MALAAPLVAASEPPEVWIDSPTSLTPAIGEVEVVVSVVSEEQIATVEIFVDGESKGILIRPPYRVRLDTGSENESHLFRVVARTVSGLEGAREVRTPALQVDDAVDLELQQLYVTVTSNGQRRLDLKRADFRVVDDGDEQEIVTFESGEVPLTAMLLLDCSLSMKGERIEAAFAGVSEFLDGMAELDRAMLLLFSDRVLHMTEFSDQKDLLAASLGDVQAAGGTSLNDHLFLGLSKLDAEQGRRVLIVFSDGSDAHSALPMEEVLHKARTSQALIYWVYLIEEGADPGKVPQYLNAWRDIPAHEREFRALRRAVNESGGRIKVVDSPDQLRTAFAEILGELREQYVLGYYPSNSRNDGAWHNVRIRVRGENLSIRTRDGYLDY